MSFITDLFAGPAPDASQAKFKPYAMSSALGNVTFDAKKGTGQTTLSPELQGMWEKYLAGANAALPSQEQMNFANQISSQGANLFGQATGMNPEQNALNYYNAQQRIMAPQREQQASMLADTLFKSGRTGAGVGMGEGYVNPEQYAYIQAMGNQDQQLALASTDRARQQQLDDISRALSMYGIGQQAMTSPYQTSANIFGNAMAIPAALNPQLAYGLQAGQSAATAGANVANIESQNRAADLGFWGGLAGSAATIFKPKIKGN